jgi:hypothetical protein
MHDRAPQRVSPRPKGLLMLFGGLARPIGLQVLLVATKVVTFEKHGRVVAGCAIVGGGIAIVGALQALLGKPWADIIDGHKIVLQVIAFLVLAGIAIGIAVATLTPRVSRLARARART